MLPSVCLLVLFPIDQDADNHGNRQNECQNDHVDMIHNRLPPNASKGLQKSSNVTPNYAAEV